MARELSYQLLSVALQYMPTGLEQAELTSLYNAAQAAGIHGTDLEVMLLQVMLSGLRSGDHDWNRILMITRGRIT